MDEKPLVSFDFAIKYDLAPFLGPFVKRDFFLPGACLHHFNRCPAS
jgi:hypothetical protein